MTYGGTRPWALWVETFGFSKQLYGTGYLYKSEEAAKRGLSRLVEKDEIYVDSDGFHRTAVMRRRVTVGKILGR